MNVIHSVSSIKKEGFVMMKTYEEQWEIRTCDCDMFSLWRPGAVMQAMQDIAGAHSSRLGAGIREMNEQGIAWVLSRGHVDINEMPVCGDKIYIETFPLPARHLFIPRVHVFRNAQRQEIGHAYCLWVVLDKQSRKMVKSSFVNERMPDNRDLVNPAGVAKTVHPLEGNCTQRVIEPPFTDFDLIGHVNNTRYLDWCYNVMGYPLLKEYCISSFDINYDHEICPGERIDTTMCIRDRQFTFTGSADAQPRFAIGGTLKARNK